MSGSTHPHSGLQRLSDDARTDFENLKTGCRRLGVSATMFRTAKFLFYIATLAFSFYLIQYAAVDPFVALTFAILLISGPEGLETWLIHRGAIDSGTDGGGGD